MSTSRLPCCCDPVVGSGNNGGGGETLAQTLVLGNVTGGSPIVISTGDIITAVTDLNLVAGDDVTMAAVDAVTIDAGGRFDLVAGGDFELVADGDIDATSGSAAPASGLGGLDITLIAGNGDGVGPGGEIQSKSGQGGATGDGGDYLTQGGPGGATSGRGGDNLVEGGDATTLGPGGDVVATAGDPAGANQDGGDVRLVPTAETGAGVEGTALVGAQAILTTLTNSGTGDAGIAMAKAAGGVDGADNPLRELEGIGGIVVVELADKVTIDGSGISGATDIKSIEVSRTSNLTLTGTPTGMSFNSDVGPAFDAAVYTWSSGNSDIEVDVDGDYEIHGEATIVATSVSEAEYEFQWFLNSALIPDGAHSRVSTAGSGFDDTPMPVASTIIRSLSATDEIGFRISRTSGSGGLVEGDTSRLSLKRIA